MSDTSKSRFTLYEPEPGVCEAQVTVTDSLGLHARPAALLAQAAQRFEAELFICLDGQRANAKSILDILSLSAGLGTVLSLRAEGKDRAAAVRALAGLIVTRFREDEDETAPAPKETL